MITLRQTVYSLVAAGSLLMAGVQALAEDEPQVEAGVVGLALPTAQAPAPG